MPREIRFSCGMNGIPFCTYAATHMNVYVHTLHTLSALFVAVEVAVFCVLTWWSVDVKHCVLFSHPVCGGVCVGL